MREVICLSNGDSSKISTWSGVPYFFLRELEKAGVVVHRVNISPDKRIAELYDKTFRRLIRFFSRDSSFYYYNSIFYYFRVSKSLRNAIQKYKSSDFILSFSYLPFSFDKGARRVVLFCDWTLQYYIEQRLKRTPDLFERFYINRENRMICHSDVAFSLFSSCAEYIKSKTNANNVFVVNGNVTNAVFAPSEGVIEAKEARRRIVFIGRNHYLAGLNALLKCFNKIRKQYPLLELDIIGIGKKDCDSSYTYDGVNFYGYLNKDKHDECQKFYDILSNASLIVNPNVGWAGYTSLVEAMYYYTPVVTTKFDAFVEDFGEQLNFGAYCNPENVGQAILDVLSSPSYREYCLAAHKAVSTYTWENYIKYFLKLV